MPITFGSVGDIISLCGLIQKLVKALDDARGSAREYRDLVHELDTLQTAIQEVKRLSDENSNILELGPLFETAGKGAAQCKQEVERFLQELSKYHDLSDQGVGRKVIRSSVTKARWELRRSDIVKFRGHIAAHSSTMTVLLSAISIHRAQSTAGSYDERRSTVASNALTEQRNLFHSIRTWCTTCEGYFIQAAKQLKDTTVTVLRQFDWLRDATTEIKDSVREIFALNFRMYGELMRVQTSIEMHLAQSPSSAFGSAWILDDCIGRSSPVHQQFIISWEAFQLVLENRFKGLPGYNKIRRREYALQDVHTGAFVPQRARWETDFIPGHRYTMSILFEDRGEDDDSTLSSCPNCQHLSQNGSETESKCARCGLLFQRILEESDESECDATVSFRKQAKVTGPRVRQSIKRRKYRPWFSASSPIGPKVTTKKQSSIGQKRHRGEFESSESEPDHASFKRIRLVSKGHECGSEHKKKRARLHRSRTERNGEAFNSLSVAINEIGLAQPNDHITDSEETDTESLIWSRDSREYFCGRAYRSFYDTDYLRPSDDEEQDGDSLLFYVIRLLMNDSLYLAPLKFVPKRILDLGTGTGDWVIEVGDGHTESRVTGLDIAPIQPTLVPPNTGFVIENVLDLDVQTSWCSKPRYDLVHCGNLCTAVKDWVALVHAAYKSLRPGGYFEVQEFLPFPILDTADTQPLNKPEISQNICDAYSACGIDLEAPLHLASVFRTAGFTDVQQHIFHANQETNKKASTGTGLWFTGTLDGLTNKPFQQGLGWSNERRIEYVKEEKMRNRRQWTKQYFKLVVVYGMKET